MEIQERANKYASEKTSEVMIQAIAQAYKDGYQDGYKDCEMEIPLEVQKDKTEFVDLGLPSGTLWAADYERENGIIKYLPYDKASKLNIPTEEQWKELSEACRWEYKFDNNDDQKHFVCVGPNGNCIHFYYTRIVRDGECAINCNKSRFWIHDTSDESDKKASGIRRTGGGIIVKEVVEIFGGYKIPVRLVQK